MKMYSARKAGRLVAMVLTIAMVLAMLPIQVAASESQGGVLYRLPAGGAGTIETAIEVVEVTSINYGAGATEAFVVHPAGTVHPGLGGWVMAPFAFVPYNSTEHSDEDFLDYVYAISFTLHVPVQVYGMHHTANPPILRFDTRVLPVSDASAMMVNPVGVFQTPYDFNLVPAAFYDLLPPEYNGTVPRESLGFRYRVDMDAGLDNFLPTRQVTIGGVDYISLDYKVYLSDFVSLQKDEIHFTVSMGNWVVSDNIYMTELTAHFGDVKHGGASATEPPARIYMDGHTGGISINDFHFMQRYGAPIVTSRGVWGGTQSRITETAEGIFVTYTHRHDDEDLVDAAGVDGLAMHGRVAFLFRPNGSQEWHLLYEWEESVGSPTIASDAAGNVYVVSHMTQDGSHEPGSAASRATFRPWVAQYVAGSWDGSSATIRHFIWEEMTETTSNSYTAVGFSQDGRIVLGTSGNVGSGSNPDQNGNIDLLVFCTNTLRWTDAGRLWTGQRFAYKYINFDAAGNIQIIGHRNCHYVKIGYPNNPGLGNWVFDGFYYWTVNRNFFDTVQNNYPPEAFDGMELGNPTHPELISFVEVLSSTPISLADPAVYAEIGDGLRRPSISNASNGDTFWDDNGDIHMIYMKTYHGNNFRPEMWHAVIRDGGILFNGPIMAAPRGANPIFFTDADGNYYIFVILGGTPVTKATGLLYTAVGFDNTGWTWERVGSFTLPAPHAHGAINNMYNVGMTGRSNVIYIMYAVRYPLTAAGTNANYWAFMQLELGPVAPAAPLDVQRSVARFVMGDVNFTVDGALNESSVAPFLTPYYRVMVPLCAVEVVFNTATNWDDETGVVTIGGYELAIDAPLAGGMGTAVVVDGYVFVPLRYVAGLFGADVRWDGSVPAVYVYN